MAGGAAPRLNSSPNGVHLTGEAHQTPASQDISTNQKQQDRQEQPHQRRHQSNQPLASQLNRNKTCYTALNAHIYNILIAHSKGREPLLRYPNLRPSNTLTTQDARPPPICPPPRRVKLKLLTHGNTDSQPRASRLLAQITGNLQLLNEAGGRLKRT